MAGELVEAGEAAPEVLELAEKAFDEVTFLVTFGVILTRVEAVSAGRDDRFSAQLTDSRADVLSVIAFVSEDELSMVVLKECLSVRRFMRLTRGEVHA